MILDIIKNKNKILRVHSVDIDNTYKNLDVLIDNMFETLEYNQGLGLAAPQIGLNINLFVVHYIGKNYVFINPILKYPSKEQEIEFEMCLSLPNIKSLIYRYKTVEVQYYDENFNEINKTFTGFFGTKIQHEYDHLVGKLNIDY